MQVGITIATATLPLLGVFFLDHLLKLVQFLAQLCTRLLGGIGFLVAFLGSAEIEFFCSVFLDKFLVQCVTGGKIADTSETDPRTHTGTKQFTYGESLYAL